MKKILETVIASLAISAILASAKAIVDVEVLKMDNKNVKEMIREVHKDVREIRTHIIK